MQIGFLLLEGGRVRSKNSINVAQKNVSDLLVAWVAYFLFGFFIMYGITMPVSGESSPSPLHFLFQLGFCATAASIVSGGVAERMRFLPYLVLAIVIGGLIYPVTGRLVWGDSFVESPFTWLGDIGFVDFAGAAVVHGVGGWAALVAILMIGARCDRFDENGKPRVMAGHSSIMALQGALLLTFGWIGFNAGSISVSDPKFAEVIVNTFSAAAFGAAGGILIGVWLDKGLFNPARTINGLLGGLVGSTAAIHVMHAYESMLIGFLAGALATYASHYLLMRWKFDDPVDVVSTHGIAGLFGTLAYAFVAPAGLLVGGSRIIQFGIQLFGAVVIFFLVVSITYASLKLLSRFTSLRVSEEEELLGLNISEHGESIGTDRLHKALHEKVNNVEPFAAPLDIDSGDENADLANLVNTLVNKQEQARVAIEESEKKFQQFANTASDWLWESNAELELSSLSGASDLNTTEQDLLKNKLNLLDLVQVNESDSLLIHNCCELGEKFGPVEGEFSPTTDYTSIVEIRGTVNKNSQGQIIGYRGTLSDITSRKLAENRAVFLSMHDELTGLLNRRALESSLPMNLQSARKNVNRLAVVGIDLDGFKAVNDSYGHSAGDELLLSLSRRIETLLAADSSFYRTGGDEFVLVIENLDTTNIEAGVNSVVETVFDEIQKPISIQDNTVQVSASIGLAIYPDNAMDPVDLQRRADLAMYAAKHQGKSQIIWFEPSLDNEMDHRFKLESELKRAIVEKELYLLYQPLVDTETQKLKSFEALVRWRHPEKGELSPIEFIGLVEKHRLMDLLGGYVLDQACEFASSWSVDSTGVLPRISVNISPSQLRSGHFASTVLQSLEKHNLDPKMLELEITEEALIESHENAMTVIEQLQSYGIAFSIDDFGTGQTSLRYLSNFPVKSMKIDRSFVKNIGKNDRATEITRSRIAMGARLGYSVVAEGVEDIQQLEMLKSWNCPIVQGYYFSKPVSGSDALEIMSREGGSENGFHGAELPKAG